MKVCGFMLESAECDAGIKVAIFFVELYAGLRNLSLPFWRLLFPVATLEPAFYIFQHDFV